MKKIKFVFACVVLLTSASTFNLNAQKVDDIAKNSFREVPSSAGLTVSGQGVGELKAQLKIAKINGKVTGYLNSNFNEFSNLEISEATDKSDLILAKFNMQKKMAKVAFNKNGNWLYSIISYTEEDLPVDVKGLVKKWNSEYNITYVKEIFITDIHCYKVFLENCRNFKQVYVNKGNITVAEQFAKQ